MKLQIKDGRENLCQWDTGRSVVVSEPCDVVHFSNMPYGKAFTVAVVDGEAIIPDKLLQSGAMLYCYAFVGSVENGYTEYSQQFVVEKKPKPTDYVFTPTEYVTIEQLDERVTKLEKYGGGGSAGFSPIVEIIPIDNGHRVAITDITGTHSFDVLNGEKGERGEQGPQGIEGPVGPQGPAGETGAAGADGYTPVKGEDYFTEADKAEFVTDVLNALPTWQGGEY
jgi:hypothetical protein